MARNLDNILAGIYSKFTSDTSANSLYDLVDGRYYLSIAPQDVTEPYIVVKVVSQVPDWCFGLSTMETIRIQFSIYTSDIQDNTNVIAILDKLRDTYDWATLTISGYSFISMRRDVSTGPLLDNGLYATQDYLLMVQES